MSGIFGIINWDGKPIEHYQIQQMSTSLGKRAPDSEKIWIQGKYAIGHRMLHTTPESLHERLPYIDQESGIVITADARIDNREVLASRLGASNLIRQGISDSQLILLSYRKWGKGCLDFLRGDYAFVILDPARQQLTCARDHFGVRPLYYRSTTNMFAFASEVRALKSIGPSTHELNDSRVADYLLPQLEGVDYETTCYKNIFRLRPGYYLSARAKGTTTDRYWRPDPVEELQLGCENEYADAYRSEFSKAVTRRLRCNKAPGILLSGGIDSAAVTVEARKQSADKNTQIHLLSIIDNSNPDCIESNNIKRLISNGDSVNHLIDVMGTDAYWQAIKKSIKNADDIFSVAVTFQKVLYQYFHDIGGNVVLDGVEGDLVTSSSYGFLNQMIRDGDWKTAYTTMRISGSDHSGLLLSIYRMVRIAISNELPLSLKRIYRNYGNMHRYRITAADSLLKPEFCKRINLYDRLSQAKKHRFGTSVETPNYEQIRLLRNPGMLPVAMDRWDRLGSEFSIEMRHPFLDVDFVNFCLSIPWQFKHKDGWSKWILRYSFMEDLPPEIVWRKGREHLGWNTNLRFIEAHLEDIKDLITDSENAIYEYICINKLRKIWKRYWSAGSDLDADKLWEAYSLSMWLHAQRNR